MRHTQNTIAGALPFQESEIRHTLSVLKKRRLYIRADDTGVGKTYMVCLAAKMRKRRLFVVCPKPGVHVWSRAAAETGCEIAAIFGFEKLKTGRTPFGKFRYRNKDKENEIRLNWVWNLPPDVDLAIDEAHRCKGESTANSELPIAAKKQKIPFYWISATSADSPVNMKALGFCTEMHDLSDFEDWAMGNGCIRNSYGNLEFTGSPAVIRQFHRHIFPKWGGRITTKSLGKLFPETLIIPTAYDMSNAKKIARVYAEMENQLALWELNRSTDKGMNPLLIILRARQKVELLKVPEFVELAKDGRAEGNSVCIFVNFTATLWEIANRLKTQCAIWGGNRKTKYIDERQENNDRFQANLEKYIVCNIRAGSTSINMHDIHGGHPRLSLISPNYSAIDMIQTFGRPHRAKGKTKSVQRIVFAANSIEEKICERVKGKIRNVATLNDGDLLASDHLLPFIGAKEMGAVDTE